MHGLFGCCLALWVRIPESDATTATTQRTGACSAHLPRDRHEAPLAPTPSSAPRCRPHPEFSQYTSRIQRFFRFTVEIQT